MSPSTRSTLDPPVRRSQRQSQQHGKSQATLPTPGETPEPHALARQPATVVHPMDSVPLDVARVIVGLREFYDEQLEAERKRSDQLEKKQHDMQAHIETLERRLQTHVVLMDGFVGFMTQIKEGKFAVAPTESPETQIARSFGGDHLEAVQGLMSLNRAGTVAPLAAEEQALPTVEEEQAQPTVEEAEREQQREDVPDDTMAMVPFSERNLDDLPPTPDLEAPPTRSTGRRAPKRKQTESTTKSKRQRLTSPEPYLLSERRSLRANPTWTAINVQTYSEDEYEPSEIDGAYESEMSDEDGQDDDDDASRNPPIQSEDTTAVVPTSATSNPSDPSNESRYKVGRQCNPRFAIGPPGRPFKFTRMERTVWLVYRQYKYGLRGQPAIEALGDQYGTTWRTGPTDLIIKFGSNYVAGRKSVALKVEEMSRTMNITVEEACKLLDEKFTRKITTLIKMIRLGFDPVNDPIPTEEEFKEAAARKKRGLVEVL